MTPGENALCVFSAGSGQARGAPQSRFAQRGPAAAQPRLTFLAALGAERCKMSPPTPTPTQCFLDPRNGF